jgi:glycine hydroxymethyltransferase
MNQSSFHQTPQERLGRADPVLAEILSAEADRQRTHIRLIPSENYLHPDVAFALVSSFGNKYSEGYPHKWRSGELILEDARYYQGQVHTNRLELLAIRRALEFFTPDPSLYHCNVQPLSGAPANLAVLAAFLKPGDSFMGMSLSHGGHLTHGHDVSVTGQYYRAIQYNLNADNHLDYDQIRDLAKRHHPKLIFCGASAYPLRIDFSLFRAIADEVGAILAADISHISALCALGAHPHPFPHADVVTTTTHKVLRGPRGALILCKKRFGPAVDKAVFPGLQGGRHMNVVAAAALALQYANAPEFRDYVMNVVKNAATLADQMIFRGFNLVGGGTETHLVLVDIAKSDVPAQNGVTLAKYIEEAGIDLNKNSVPGDTKPWLPSGIRLGTPAVTTIGLRDVDMRTVADWIALLARKPGDAVLAHNIKGEVADLMRSTTVMNWVAL